jgi:hypothetical protein
LQWRMQFSTRPRYTESTSHTHGRRPPAIDAHAADARRRGSDWPKMGSSGLHRPRCTGRIKGGCAVAPRCRRPPLTHPPRRGERHLRESRREVGTGASELSGPAGGVKVMSTVDRRRPECPSALHREVQPRGDSGRHTVVDAQRPRCVSEPDPVQMSQQGVDGGCVRTGRPAHGVSDPDHTGADIATAQWFLTPGCSVMASPPIAKWRAGRCPRPAARPARPGRQAARTRRDSRRRPGRGRRPPTGRGRWRPWPARTATR